MKRMPLSVRLALFRNKCEREKPPPRPVVPCEPGDKVIVALDGRYRNGEVVKLPYYEDDERYVRVRLEEAIVKLKADAVVKVET